MPGGLSIALVMLAQAAAGSGRSNYGPVAEVPPAPAAAPRKAEDRVCTDASKDSNSNVIVICGPPPQGYRLNPDVLEARREMKNGGKPKSQQQRMEQGTNCAVGPAGCQYAGINLLGAALTAAQMAKRLANGQEVESMFVTDPHPTEYQLYLQAKREREAKEAAAAAKAAQAKAEAQAKARASGASAN